MLHLLRIAVLAEALQDGEDGKMKRFKYIGIRGLEMNISGRRIRIGLIRFPWWVQHGKKPSFLEHLKSFENLKHMLQFRLMWFAFAIKKEIQSGVK